MTIAEWAKRAGVSVTSARAYNSALNGLRRSTRNFVAKNGMAAPVRYKSLTAMGTKGVSQQYLEATTKSIRVDSKNVASRSSAHLGTIIGNAVQALYNYYGDTADEVATALDIILKYGDLQMQAKTVQAILPIFEPKYTTEGEWDDGPDTGELEILLKRILGGI